MITVMDDTIRPGRDVRTLLYDDAAELTGSVVNTHNGGTVECEAGSLAVQPGITGMKQLNGNGEWIDC